jgi:hypothetical protein
MAVLMPESPGQLLGHQALEQTQPQPAVLLRHGHRRQAQLCASRMMGQGYCGLGVMLRLWGRSRGEVRAQALNLAVSSLRLKLIESWPLAFMLAFS